MLLHHFGSREELLLAIVDEVEHRQQALLRELDADSSTGFADDVGTPAPAGTARARAVVLRVLCPRRPGREAFHHNACRRRWTAGWPRWQTDRDEARLGLAVMRGLLLDLAGTDDDAGVDAAAQRFIELLRLRGLRDERL